jgi:hypothetical protein
MSRLRKTRDEYQLLVNYGQGWEHEVTEDTWKDARAQAKTYRANCAFPVKIRAVRIPREMPAGWCKCCQPEQLTGSDQEFRKAFTPNKHGEYA